MRTRLRWKVMVVCTVTAIFAVLGVFPGLAVRYDVPAPRWLIDRQLKLGLDLRGGTQLILRADVDTALDPILREESIEQTRLALLRRIDALGVTEATVARQGRGSDRLIVELPGVTDVDRARQVIGATGLLEFCLVDGSAPTSATPEVAAVTLRGPAIVTGGDIRSARPGTDEYGMPAVTFTLSEEAGRRFSEVTAANIGQRLAVVLDGQVESVATIENRIASSGQIRGSFTPEEVADLAVVLRSGALPAAITHLGQNTVGPSLGADSIRAGMAASVGGLVLVAAFMVMFYGWWGVNAVVAMLVNLTILVGLLAYVEAVLTLPGIAGVILTVGMGVDSNVLIFERMKEQMAAGQSARVAMRAAFDRVFVTLLDTHVAALIAAACLFQFGTGPISGFAVTLSLGLISNLFTSTFVSRTLFELGQRQKVRSTAAASST